jgi:hypothetical protein
MKFHIEHIIFGVDPMTRRDVEQEKMRGFIVVNRINDVFYLDCDTEFTNHVNIQAVEQGLLEVDWKHRGFLSHLVLTLYININSGSLMY